MIPRSLLLLAIAAVLAGVPTFVSGQRGSRSGHPNLEGIWNSATATPLERPKGLENKPFFTSEEAAEWERQFVQRNEEPPPGSVTKCTGTGTYNTFFREFGTRTVKTLRTSIITDPPDGRIPALTPAAAEIKRQRLDRLRKFENPEDLGLQDRCLAFSTAGPPMLPYSYNRFEIDNPTAFTQPWKGELTMTRGTGNIHEFACHEGNYSLTNMLRGYRAAERKPGGPPMR